MKHKEISQITTSVKATKDVAKKIIEKYKPLIKKQGGTILLRGELGSGKTAFTQGLAGFFKIKKVNSPTFTILKKYESLEKIVLIHIDCYRLKNYKELREIGFEKFINKKNIIVVVEWPEIISLKVKRGIKNLLELNFEHISEKKRNIIINKVSIK